MSKKTIFSFKSVLIFFILFAMFLIFPNSSQAESLADVHKELLEYQSQPLERIKILKAEILKIQGLEEGLARQYGIPVYQVINYEMMLENNIQTYHNIYFLQKQGTTPSQFILEEGRIDELAEKTPPYSFLLYLDFIEDVENYNNEADRFEWLIKRTKATLLKNTEERAEAEKRFRLVNNTISNTNGNNLKNSWEIKEVKAKLEKCVTVNTLSNSTLSLTEKELNETKNTIAIVEPILDKIRENIKFNSEDFAQLNFNIMLKTEFLYRSISVLERKLEIGNELNNDLTEITPFTRFWISNEKQLIRDEILMVLELIEKLTSLRSVWRGMQDLIEGNLDMSGQKFILSRTNDYISDISTNIRLCVDAIQTIRETEQAVKRRFSEENPLITDGDAQNRDQFLENLHVRKTRYLSYLVDLGMIKSQYQDLQKESMRIAGQYHNEDKLNFLWGVSLAKIKDTELWYVGESPITVGKFSFALLIFLFGIAITRYFVYLFKKRTSDGLSITRHGNLVIQKFIYYTGVTISTLFGLWNLHIPITAFAFLGGAAAIIIGFGTQRYTGDIFSGIILLFQKKIRIGDEVIIADRRGIVEEITLQNTIVRCEQSNHLIIPNSKVLEGSIVNLTLNNSFSRTEVSISVAYDTEIEKAMCIMREILSKDRNVLNSPPYKILLEDFGESSIKLTAQFFVDIKDNLERDVRSSIRQKILAEFNNEKIEIPFPQSDVRIKSDSKEQ